MRRYVRRYRRRRPRFARRQGRRRRVFRPRYRRGVASGTFRVKLTHVSTFTAKNDAVTHTWMSFEPKDFDEFSNLAPNFEAYKFTKCRVRVIPMQNVSNNSTSQVPMYCILPWHTLAPQSNTFEKFMSVDKAKIFKQTQTGSMVFNVNTLSAVAYADGQASLKTEWMPRIEIDANAYMVRHFAGLIAFQGDPSMADRSTKFTIVQDVWCTFYNQKTLK
ncbi:coat protein [army ant associated cyclovirus 3 P1A-reste_4]|uniref:Coat protein n=1 Tax=army ant associated cyclovirus 3 P1A-reste_4 TaxID=3070163 RepID=A0AA47LWQ2_9CIRC|nr:coat protein [Army ant associated cyclovirus 3]WBG01403.1 coat protein [Army ant associated cyclovirus 3]WBG01411.1 coat protein [Army ant associated cyclovirus 3]WBG01421.1 coat protein [Army ant associated cyclovirus 3]WBG01425.1 coat protein [Army ant associated cyclovirus 3]WBG01427.1 coat protein [Army ant associated cyclovirus 3]